MSSLAISIVTYCTDFSYLRSSLKCVYASKVSVNVTVVDNSPTDNLRVICKDYPCNYIHNPSNPGYGAAHNIALKNSLDTAVDYHLVLNADVVFSENVLYEIMKYMEENKNIGQIMPKVLNPDGSIQKLCKLVPTPIDLILRRFLPYRFSKKSRKRFELWDSGYSKTMFVPYLSGCFMFLRCDALKSVGIFDERFFMYPEDIDLTRRIASKFDTVFYPHVEVIHEHGAASYRSIRMLWVHIINIIKYFNKWGWIFDKDRDLLNKKTLSMLGLS
jgi:GT2 family glycosyltransferase